MKRFIAISTAFLYILLNVGIIAHVHTCHDGKSNIALTQVEADCCHTSEGTNNTCCESNHSTKENTHNQTVACCEDDVIVFQFTEISQIPSEQFSLVVFPIEKNFTSNNLLQSFHIQKTYNLDFLDYSPPPKEPLFSLHCSFIFYS